MVILLNIILQFTTFCF